MSRLGTRWSDFTLVVRLYTAAVRPYSRASDCVEMLWEMSSGGAWYSSTMVLMFKESHSLLTQLRRIKLQFRCRLISVDFQEPEVPVFKIFHQFTILNSIHLSCPNHFGLI